MPAKLCRIFVVSALLAGSAALAAANKPTVESIGDQVMCLCGCVANLNHCPHVQCSEKEEMRAFIAKEIAAGKDEKSILQAMAIRYGVQVLASPPAKGFDLTVWILPGLGLAAGLALVVLIARRWRIPAATPSTGTAASVDPKLLAAMEEEMKQSGLGVRD